MAKALKYKTLRPTYESNKDEEKDVVYRKLTSLSTSAAPLKLPDDWILSHSKLLKIYTMWVLTVLFVSFWSSNFIDRYGPSREQIEQNIKQLGFKLSDVRLRAMLIGTM